ncbi:MAG: Fur family transcriptional regulator [Candidatus Thorarchaeota archaeon]
METEEIISIFKEYGFKVTTQRLAICKLILSRKDHPSTEKMHKLLKEDYPTISLGTIYNTLHLLKEMGLIQELGFDEGSIRYDPDMELHINMVCSKCRKIYDYKAENVKKMWNSIIPNLGIKPTGQRIDVYFGCDNCKD